MIPLWKAEKILAAGGGFNPKLTQEAKDVVEAAEAEAEAEADDDAPE